MKFRNLHYNRHGAIDCEVEHPEHGWIPFTASSADPSPTTAAVYAAIMESGEPIAPYVSPTPTAEEQAQVALDAQLDSEFSAAKLDAWVVQFLAMTPSGAQDYINANSATLAALRVNVARLAYAVRVLIKREFRV